MAKLFSRTLWIASAAALGVVGVGSGQAQPPGDELLAEVRALRAELNQAASTSLRAQLLVARLQLQEQRLSADARQLSEVQDKLTGMEAGMIPLVAQLKHAHEEPIERLPPEQRQEVEEHRQMLQKQVDQMRKMEQELRSQEVALAARLTESQSRWTDFNERLDELERVLPVRPR